MKVIPFRSRSAQTEWGKWWQMKQQANRNSSLPAATPRPSVPDQDDPLLESLEQLRLRAVLEQAASTRPMDATQLKLEKP